MPTKNAPPTSSLGLRIAATETGETGETGEIGAANAIGEIGETETGDRAWRVRRPEVRVSLLNFC